MEENKAQKEKKKAAEWYLWLFLSPLLTVFTAYIIFIFAWRLTDAFLNPRGHGYIGYGNPAARLALLISILGSALWHLILLIPALDKESIFVSWHGKQALLLAGVRTAVPLVFVGFFGMDGLILSILLLIVIWLFGTLWGQGEARQGKCSLAGWFGKAEEIMHPEPAAGSAVQDSLNQISAPLLEIIRYSPEKSDRDKALADLRASLPLGSRLVRPFFYRRSGLSVIPASDSRIEALLKLIRSSPDRQLREKALLSLTDWGLVDIL